METFFRIEARIELPLYRRQIAQENNIYAQHKFKTQADAQAKMRQLSNSHEYKITTWQGTVTK